MFDPLLLFLTILDVRPNSLFSNGRISNVFVFLHKQGDGDILNSPTVKVDSYAKPQKW